MNYDLIIFDLDNTIYDWYSSFLPAFYRMIDVASEIMNQQPDKLLDELKRVHIQHGDVEHPFSLLETETARGFLNIHGPKKSEKLLDHAFHEFNRVRKVHLRLFPFVKETLTALKSEGIKVVAHTDAKFFGAVGRLQRLDLVDNFDLIYCRERDDSLAPASYVRKDRSSGFLHKIVELPSRETKPNAHILERIISNHESTIWSTAYVGDSLSKDMLMAKTVGCTAIWAKYGSQIDPDMFERLVRISHWSESDIENERHFRSMSKNIRPDFVCENNISELLPYIKYQQLALVNTQLPPLRS